MAKDRRSKDQKRKAKLTARTQRERQIEYLTPYSGSKYKAAVWVPLMHATELPVYQAIVASNRFLTNAQVRDAYLKLLELLHAGNSPLLPEDAPEVAFQTGNEVEHLCWGIRKSWDRYFKAYGAVSNADRIGILRTLLGSMEIQNWRSGSSRGYVAFLWEFFRQSNLSLPMKLTAEELLELYHKEEIRNADTTGTTEDDASDSE